MGYNSTANVWNRVGVSNATTGGNENLVDRIKINASLRMIDNAQPSGSKLVGVTGTQALGLDVNLKTVGITNAVLGGNETLLDRLKVNASLRMIDTSQPVGSQLIGATGTQTSGLDVNIKNAKVNVEIAETQSDIHGQLVGVTRVTQLGVKFFQQSPQSALNITLVGTGTTSSGIGTGIFSTGTGTQHQF